MLGVLQVTDWQRICSDLRRTFGTLRKVSRTLHHRNPDYLTKLERGEISDPRYSLGEGLIELYKLHVDTSIPMIGGGKQERLF